MLLLAVKYVEVAMLPKVYFLNVNYALLASRLCYGECSRNKDFPAGLNRLC